MGMWDKDREIGSRPEDTFGIGEPFVLVHAEVRGTIDTRLGKAAVAHLFGCRLGPNGLGPIMEASTVASAVVDKVGMAEAADFPAVVQLQRVDSRARGVAGVLVLSFVSEYRGEVPPLPALGESRADTQDAAQAATGKAKR